MVAVVEEISIYKEWGMKRIYKVVCEFNQIPNTELISTVLLQHNFMLTIIWFFSYHAFFARCIQNVHVYNFFYTSICLWLRIFQLKSCSMDLDEIRFESYAIVGYPKVIFLIMYNW